MFRYLQVELVHFVYCFLILLFFCAALLLGKVKLGLIFRHLFQSILKLGLKCSNLGFLEIDRLFLIICLLLDFFISGLEFRVHLATLLCILVFV